MPVDNSNWTDSFIHILALVSKLEGEGLFNIAKLFSPGADVLSRRATCQLAVPSGRESLIAEIELSITKLSGLDTD